MIIICIVQSVVTHTFLTLYKSLLLLALNHPRLQGSRHKHHPQYFTSFPLAGASLESGAKLAGRGAARHTSTS